jgi:ABC-type multidrug transport system fused ATPase/permease subunit
VVVTSGLVLLVSGLVTLWSNSINIRLAMQFAMDQSRYILTLKGGRPFKNSDPSKNPYPKDVQNRSKSIVIMARAIRPLLQVFQPLFQFLFSFAALVYIDFIFTILIFLGVLPSLYFQYVINYKASKNEDRRGPTLKNMQTRITSLLDNMAFAPQINQSGMSFLEKAYAREEITELPEVYINRILARPKSQAISNILIAVLLMGTVSYLGINALQGDITWALMLGYLAFARTGMMALRKLIGTITGFARHYTRTRKTFDLLESWPGQKQFEKNILKIEPANGEVSPGDLKVAKIRRGEVLSVLSPVPLSRFNTYAYADALGSHRSVNKKTLWGAMVCIPDALDSCPGASLRELLNISHSMSKDKVRQKAKKFQNEIVLSDLDVDALLEAETWSQLPIAFRCHLLLDQGARENGDVILVENSVLASAEEWYRDEWLGKMAARFLIVHHNEPVSVGSWGEGKVLAMRTDRSIALMTVDWASQNIDDLTQWFDSARISENGDGSLDDDDDDD